MTAASPTLLTDETPVTAEAQPTDVALSTLLRSGTRQEHREAESMGFIETLMSGAFGERGRDAYTALAGQQHAIYGALEAASAQIAATDEGAAAGIVFAELTRTPSIEADLEHLLGAGWREQVTVLPATAAYVASLRASGASLPLYAAHAYTRYLGDLSGGQVIRAMMQRHYGFGDEGVSFYHFAEIEKPKVFKDLYRERLDALPLDDAGRAAAVAEAQVAFRHNQDLFAALGEIFL